MVGYRLSRMGICGVLLTAALGSASTRAADLSKVLPDDTAAVLNVNVKQLLNSDVVKKYGLDKMKAELKGNAEAVKVLGALGFDPFTDLDDIVVAPGDLDFNKMEKVLIVLQGKFKIENFRKVAADAAQKEPDNLKIVKAGDYTVYQVAVPKDDGSKQMMFVALADSSNLVASGSKDYLVDALDRVAGKKKAAVNKEMQALLGKADLKQSVTLVLLGSFLGKLPGLDNQSKQIVDKVKQVTAGVNVTNEVKTEVVIGTTSADEAQAMAKLIQANLAKAKGIVPLLAAGQPQFAIAADVLNTVQVAPKASDVSIQAKVSQDVIEKASKLDK